MSRLTYGDVEAGKLRHSKTARRLTHDSILQHVQPASQAIPADGVPSAGEADVMPSGTRAGSRAGASAWLCVLPSGASVPPSRNLWGLGQLRGHATALGERGAG